MTELEFWKQQAGKGRISRREFIVTTSCPITNNTVQEYDHGRKADQ